MTFEPVAPQKKTSVWVYVGIGCAGVMLLGCLVFSAITYYAAKKVQGFAKNLDPAQRDANAAAMLGSVPPGYYTYVSMDVLFASIAVFGDKPPLADGGEPDFARGFAYYRIFENDECRRVKDAFRDGGTSDEVFQHCQVGVNPGEVLVRGVIDNGGRKVLYMGQMGDMRTQQVNSSGMQSVLFFECPQDAKVRVGIWFEKYDGPALTVETIPAGSVLDKKALEDFLKPLNPCGR
ncbi:MAG: hypothetical protein K1X64_01260 [Myxococcaceae bacterium]|nr:hypothetical protein [Myxococcaceae bacterium]